MAGKFGTLAGPGTQAPKEQIVHYEVKTPEWLGTPPETAAPSETHTAQIVVIGAGHAGLACARRAAELGSSVILIEAQKEKQYSAFGFDIGHINSQWQQEQGIPHYDPVEFISSYQLQCAGRAQPDLLRSFAWRSGEAFDWFISALTPEERAEIFPLNWPMEPDYQIAIGPFRTYPGSAELAGPLMRTAMQAGLNKAQESGAEILFGTRAIKLLTENGRITGVVCQTENGRIIHCMGTRGVVLAAGDFSGDPVMLRELCTEAGDTNSGIAIHGAGRDGSGVKMGLWAGARIEVGPRGAMGGAHAAPMGPGGTIATLWLNRDGKRFCNEAFGGPSVAAVQGARQPQGNLYAVWDGDWEYTFYHQMSAHFNLKYWGDAMRQDIAAVMEGAQKAGAEGFQSGRTTVYCADTLEQLAAYLGLDETQQRNFVASVERYNGWCHLGVDQDYAKDPSMLRAIEKPPFYAFGGPKMTGMILVSLAGLEVNGEQNCVDQNFEPIPGLYATGNCSGGRFPLQYTSPLNGISIGMALTLGYVLGEQLAQ
jgi:succinate dehydrogenase/fumarate reductase flavoprotein subunit